MDHHCRIPAVCIVCGADFMARKDELKRGFAKCCSRRCASSLGRLALKQMAFSPTKSKAEQIRASGLVNMRERRGAIVKPSCCQQCGVQGKKLDKHHEDYQKPDEVVFLCRSCHMKRHWRGEPLAIKTEDAA